MVSVKILDKCLYTSSLASSRQYLLARLIANWHRRQLSKEEKTAMLDAIAKKTGWFPKEIAEKTGIHPRTLLRYISDDYKNEEFKALRQKQIDQELADRLSAKKIVAAKKKAEQELVANLATKADPSKISQEGLVKPQEEEPRVFKPTGLLPLRKGTLPLNPLDIDLRMKFVDGFDMWFIHPSNPVNNAPLDTVVTMSICVFIF